MATNYKERYWPLVIRENSLERQSLNEVREGSGKTLPSKELPSSVHCFPHRCGEHLAGATAGCVYFGLRFGVTVQHARCGTRRVQQFHTAPALKTERKVNSGALRIFPPFPHFIWSRVTACEIVPPKRREDCLSSTKPLWKHPHLQVGDSIPCE